MSEVKRTDPALVHAIARELKPPLNPYIMGYGAKVPTAYKIKYGETPRQLANWRRVYVMQFANAGTGYIEWYGETLFLDIDTEYAISAGLNADALVNM